MVRCYRVFGFIFYSKSDSSSGDEYFKEFEARSIKSFKLDKLRAFFFLFKFQKKKFDKIDTRRNQSCIKGRNKINNRPSNLLENVRERRRKSRIVRFRDLELVYLHVCGSGKNSRSYSWINNLRVE